MGGTFDPVHNGHLEAARELRRLANLEQVWLMPNARPTHRREPAASAEDRMRMVEIALQGEPDLKPSRLEVARGGTSYTIDTVRELKRRLGGQPFEMLLGADAAKQVRQWHDAPALLAETPFLIFNRPGTRLTRKDMDELGFAPERTRTVQLRTPDIAAHEIRQRLARGDSIDDLVPPGVAAYIRAHHLYMPGNPSQAS